MRRISAHLSLAGLALPLLAVIGLLPFDARADEPPKGTTPAPLAKPELTVIRCKYVKAKDVVHVVSLLKDPRVASRLRLTVDERTNSVIVTGTPDDLALVTELVKRTDVPQD